ncbi:nucleoid occlusion protein [Lactobacillus nasalidis]|uniref:Nucleoid occlusion protein n=1 Tax=Lactobacillus nasalidis TaxID=2797258 RepID=A0ABQ3W4M6_9LACO|nr:nucleoid occlusion protein [Lactobacillus nasalidis]GHV96834.1 nucleoid occlusion protein [Lactobacillus nasalidis]GHW00302.1 nucleoid occlusion protein [Lactobacillus nasalidis]GHW00898.1 nucleoid occlusion protein [Lactobacillus nasalidis]
MAFGFFHRNEIPRDKQVQDLPLTEIHPNRYQPRRTFSDDSIKQLAQTLDQEGLLQPIVVREDQGGYEIIAGERRYRAAKSLGWEKIPAIVNNLDDQQTASLALIENLQRENLNPIDEAQAYEQLMQLNQLTQTQLAQDIGKSQSYVANKLRLLKLSAPVQESLAKGEISARHGRAMLGLTEADQAALLKEVIDHGLSVKETEERAAKLASPKPVVKKKQAVRYGRDLQLQINTIKQAVKLAKESGVKVKVTEAKSADEYQITIVLKNQRKKKED